MSSGAAPDGRSRGVVARLVAQCLLFGAMAALLGIVANALFLDAYGAGWLPATYIAIGIVGVAISGGVARAAARFDLAAISLTVLGGAAIGIGAAWVVARDGDAPWVSIPLLVLFPVLIQLGFVFIGAQAGRLLDIAGLKASFPRIMAGFPVGAVLGSVAGGQLVGWLGGTEALLLATALVQASFALLAWQTSRGIARSESASDERPGAGGRRPEPPRPGLRRLLASRFVALLMGYQVLSALGSQLADYLVFDRAAARFTDPAELASFLAWYTAVMNVVSIGFLVLVAAPLLRRYGLRVGIPANPFVLGGFAAAMLAAWAIAGPASTALLLTVSAARIADIALTDGTTRSSLQVTYQALPERTRLAVQAAIEGAGVPVAIALTGVLILALGLLADPLLATLLVTALACAAWSWIAVLLYRAYGPALVQSLRRRRLLATDGPLVTTAADEAAALRLIAAPDATTARLGIELLGVLGSPALAAELATLADDRRPDVRMAALDGLARAGDRTARQQLAAAVADGARSTDPGTRIRAARALAGRSLDGPGVRSLVTVLATDPEPAVRRAALDAVRAGDDGALDAVMAGLADPRTADAAVGAADRLGDAIVPALERALAAGTVPSSPATLRLVRSLATRTPARHEVLRAHLDHPDRVLGRALLERLAGDEPADDATATALDAVLATDLAHAGRIVAALAAVRPAAVPGVTTPSPLAGQRDTGAAPAIDALGPLCRALDDELDLVRARVVANRLARHGRLAIGPALVALAAERSTAVAAEALRVILGATEAGQLLAVVGADDDPALRGRRLPAPPGGPSTTAGWLRELVEDSAADWRSPWLRACAIHAARRLGLLGGLELGAAVADRDPVVDEELALA